MTVTDAVAIALRFTVLLLAAVVAAEEFSSSFASSNLVESQLTSEAGRSEIECAVLCKSNDIGCASTVFVPESQLCLFSDAWNADFSARAPGRSVYRTSPPIPDTTTAMTTTTAPTTTTTDTASTTTTPAPTATTALNGILVNGKVYRVMLQRLKGSLSFARTWTEYENGFGDGTDSWIGLLALNQMTGSSSKQLRVEMYTWTSAFYVSEYSGFSVGPAGTNYKMTYASYLSTSTTSKDSLANHKGFQFSTKDKDNEKYKGSCSQIYGSGGWWFFDSDCYTANPTGVYFASASTDWSAIMWEGAGGYKALKSIRILVQV